MAGANLLAKLGQLIKRPEKLHNENVEVDRHQKDLNADFEIERKDKKYVNAKEVEK